MKPHIPYRGRKPANDLPQVGEVWENLNTGRIARVVGIQERDEGIYIRLESLTLTDKQSWCSALTMSNAYTWKRKERAHE